MLQNKHTMTNGERKKKWKKLRWIPLNTELLFKKLHSIRWVCTLQSSKEDSMKVHISNPLTSNPWRITVMNSMETTGRFLTVANNLLLLYKLKDTNCLLELDLLSNLSLMGFRLFKIQVWWTQIFMGLKFQTEDHWEIFIKTVLQDKQLLKISLSSQGQMHLNNN